MHHVEGKRRSVWASFVETRLPNGAPGGTGKHLESIMCKKKKQRDACEGSGDRWKGAVARTTRRAFKWTDSPTTACPGLSHERCTIKNRPATSADPQHNKQLGTNNMPRQREEGGSQGAGDGREKNHISQDRSPPLCEIKADAVGHTIIWTDGDNSFHGDRPGPKERSWGAGAGNSQDRRLWGQLRHRGGKVEKTRWVWRIEPEKKPPVSLRVFSGPSQGRRRFLMAKKNRNHGNKTSGRGERPMGPQLKKASSEISALPGQGRGIACNRDVTRTKGKAVVETRGGHPDKAGNFGMASRQYLPPCGEED